MYDKIHYKLKKKNKNSLQAKKKKKDPLKEEMAAPSSMLAWKVPWTEKPGGLQSVGSQRAGHDLSARAGILEGVFRVTWGICSQRRSVWRMLTAKDLRSSFFTKGAEQAVWWRAARALSVQRVSSQPKVVFGNSSLSFLRKVILKTFSHQNS